MNHTEYPADEWEEEFAKLPDPDAVGSAEYRTIHELLEDAEDIEHARGICEEFEAAAQLLLARINGEVGP